eukprot:superscaffoldBa00006068_g21102
MSAERRDAEGLKQRGGKEGLTWDSSHLSGIRLGMDSKDVTASKTCSHIHDIDLNLSVNDETDSSLQINRTAEMK